MDGLKLVQNLNRRQFLRRSGMGLGTIALGGLLGNDLKAAPGSADPGGLPGLPHFAPKAKRVIFLFQSGAPSLWTRVWALTRFSASQRRIWSASTGPYWRPSVPMILYIAISFGVGLYGSLGGLSGKFAGGAGNWGGSSFFARERRLMLVANAQSQERPSRAAPVSPIQPTGRGSTSPLIRP